MKTFLVLIFILFSSACWAEDYIVNISSEDVLMLKMVGSISATTTAQSYLGNVVKREIDQVRQAYIFQKEQSVIDKYRGLSPQEKSLLERYSKITDAKKVEVIKKVESMFPASTTP